MRRKTWKEIGTSEEELETSVAEEGRSSEEDIEVLLRGCKETGTTSHSRMKEGMEVGWLTCDEGEEGRMIP